VLFSCGIYLYIKILFVTLLHYLNNHFMKNLAFLLLLITCALIDISVGSFGAFTIGMALIRFSDVVSEARGSIGGTTFSRNKSGAIARKRTKPVNTQSTYRDAVKALFGAIAQAWRGLSQAQRDNWDSEAPEYQAVNALGENFTYSGSQLFQKLNSSLQLAGQAGIDAIGSPIDVEANDTTGVELDVNGPVFEVSLAAAASANEVIVIEATPQVSAGKKNISNLFKQIHVADTGDTGTVDVEAAYTARYGVSVADMAVGAVVYVRTTVVMLENGQRGTPVIIKGVVVDTTP
jgi:hypothetical protein